MSETSFKIAGACAFGGLTGALVALSVWPAFWWAGLIVGGLVGYLSYQPKEVPAAFAGAYRKVYGFSKERELFRHALTSIFYGFASALAASNILIMPVGLYIFGAADEALTSFAAFSVFILFSLPTSAILAFAFEAMFRPEDRVIAKINVILLKYANPPALYGYWLPIWLWWFAKKLSPFIKYAFILIHSEIRLLCGLGAALGAAVGYFAGNALVGALAGGIIGFLNFEIVSKRLLRTASRR